MKNKAKKHSIKDIIIGMIIATIIFALILPVAAASIYKTIEVAYNDIKINIDGTEIIPKDANGNIVEPFIYNGTTFLPVRAIGEALGKDVSFDENTQTVFLKPKSQTASNQTDQTPAPTQAALNLPLVVQETTFQHIRGHYLRYITSEGVFREGDSKETIDIDVNVRSFYSMSETTFYIKNDNTLWGYGSNERGVLGDGTGVDKKTPIKIMDNVATVGYYSWGGFAYAIKTDKTFWVWGDGKIFEPKMMAEDVVDVIKITHLNRMSGESKILLFKSDRSLWDYDTMEIATGTFGKSMDIIKFPDEAVNLYKQYGISDECGYIDANGALWANVCNVLDNYKTNLICLADSNVVNFYGFPLALSLVKAYNIHFLKSDNSLWGYGYNQGGELGDGSKVPRYDKPVKIADDVKDLSLYAYLKTNGELWAWNIDNPTPVKVLDDVAYIDAEYEYSSRSSYVILKNGKVLLFSSESRVKFDKKPLNETIENVKIPQTVTFP